MNYIYLDNAATTKADPKVIKAMERCLKYDFGNPSSIHSMGQRGKKILAEARKEVALLLGADPDEIIFTSGGTESDNLAIQGAFRANKGNHLITTKIEHPAVLNTCKYLEEKGADVTYLDVDEDGLVYPDDFESAIREDTVLATVMYANNVMGTVEEIYDLADIAHDNGVLFHTDAVQAAGMIPIDLKNTNIDLLSISGHKLHASKGIGALYKSKSVDIEPLMYGGAHEDGLRPGTENVPGIAGFGVACRIVKEEMDDYVPEMKELRDRLIEGIEENIPQVHLNGHRTKRLPNNVNFSFKGVEGESILLKLDSLGYEVSTGSACSSKELKPSEAILATGVDTEMAHCSLRITLGRETERKYIEKFLEDLTSVISELREMSPLWQE
ncbi:MAG: cysteine desulfurase family protein [Thermoplasmata archaeon]